MSVTDSGLWISIWTGYLIWSSIISVAHTDTKFYNVVPTDNSFYGQSYYQCWLVLRRDHSARPDSTELNHLELNWVRSGAVLTVLDYSEVAARYFVPRTTSVISRLMRCWMRQSSLQSVARPTAATIALCKHRIINNGGGGWRVRCDETWGEGNGTDDWRTWHVKQNTATDRVANSCHRDDANLNHEWNTAFARLWDYRWPRRPPQMQVRHPRAIT